MREAEASGSIMVTSHSVSSAASNSLEAADEDIDAASPLQQMKVVETKVSVATSNADKEDPERSAWSGAWVFHALRKSLTEVTYTSGKTVNYVSTLIKMQLGMQNTDDSAETRDRDPSRLEQHASEYIDPQNRPLDIANLNLRPKSTHIMEVCAFKT